MYSELQKEYALKQGIKFNNYHNDYLHIIGTKKLELINETTMPNLGFLETMENKSMNPLTIENNKIKDRLVQLQNEFNKALALYTSNYEMYYNKILNKDSNIRSYTGKNIINSNGKKYYVNNHGVTRGYSDDAWNKKPESCATNIPTDDSITAYNSLENGLDYIPGQPCDLDATIIQNEQGQFAWIDEKGQKHIYPNRDIMEKTQQNGNCPTSIRQVTNDIFNLYPLSSEMNEHSSCSSNIYDAELYNQINSVNQTLLNIANEMYEEAVKLEKTQEIVGSKRKSIKSELLDNIRSLNQERDNLQNMINKSNRLSGKFEDYKLQTTSELYKYISFVFVALTLGGITYHHLTK
jgi:hypothetical protein